MTKLILDPVTRATLADARLPLELCDESGRVLGCFFPNIESPDRSLADPQVPDEELDRREREGGGRSLSAILADLEKSA